MLSWAMSCIDNLILAYSLHFLGLSFLFIGYFTGSQYQWYCFIEYEPASFERQRHKITVQARV